MTFMKNRGFTLVESLLVLAVAAILIILLIGGVFTVRQKALDAKCIGNLRQVGIAMASFASDHGGKIMPRLYNEEFDSKGEAVNRHWYKRLGLGGYLPTITKYGDSDVCYCPAFPPRGPYDKSVENPLRIMHRFGLRTWTTSDGILNDENTLLPLAAIENPSDFFLVADSYFTLDQTQGYMIAPGLETWRVHLRHNNKAHALFADWHLEAKDRAYFEDLHTRQSSYRGRGAKNYPFYIWPEK